MSNVVVGRVVRRSADRIAVDPVRFWLHRLDVDTRKADASHFRRFLFWVWKQPGWEGVTPRQLLVRHLESGDAYEMLDLVQGYVNQLPALRKSSKRKAYSAIRSFFFHNRCALPDDPTFRIRGDKPPVQPRLMVKDITEALMASDVRYRSALLVKWQSFMDSSRFIYTNLNSAEQIVEQIRKKMHPVRIDVPGRKSKENDSEGQFYTFIGRDAVDALTKYFDDERGWPKPGEPIWIQNGEDRRGKYVTKHALEEFWLRTLRRLGKIPRRRGSPGTRYGYNLHEMRDEATTFLHLQAKGEGLDMDCVKFWCGQVGEIDPLKYDKFYKDDEYMRKQYLTAEPYLNIISNPTAPKDPQAEEKMRLLQDEVQRLRQTVSEQGFAIRLLQDSTSYHVVQKQA